MGMSDSLRRHYQDQAIEKARQERIATKEAEFGTDLAKERIRGETATRNTVITSTAAMDREKFSQANQNLRSSVTAGTARERLLFDTGKDARDFGYNVFKDDRSFGENQRQFGLTRRDKLFADERKYAAGGADGLGAVAPGGKPPEDLDLMRDIEYRDRLFNMTPAEREQFAGNTAAAILASRQPGGFGTAGGQPVTGMPVRGMEKPGMKPSVYSGYGSPYQQEQRREGTINGIPESEFMKSIKGMKGTETRDYLDKTYQALASSRLPVNTSKAEAPAAGGTTVQEGKDAAAAKPPKVKPQNPPVTSLSQDEIEQSRIEYSGPARNPQEAVYGKPYSNPKTALTWVQEKAGGTQSPDAPRFGEDEIAFTLRKSGFSSDLQTLKNMSQRLREKYPDLPAATLAKLIREAKGKQQEKER